MTPKTKESSRHVGAVLRALDILDLFLQKSEFTLKEIIDFTGLTRSRTMRLVGTLESRGYLNADYQSNAYYPGIKLCILGKVHERVHQIETTTRPILKTLSKQTGESATFYIVEGTWRLPLVREEGTHAIRLSIREGKRLPLHAGASGKILMAFSSPDLLEKLRACKKLEAVTTKTITNWGTLMEEIASVRKNGYAVSRGENIVGANAIAAAVLGHDKQLIGAIGIAAPSNRLNDKNMNDRIKIVKDAALHLSRKFGFLPED